MRASRAIAALAAALFLSCSFIPGSTGSPRAGTRGGSPSGDWKQAVRERVADLAGREQSTDKEPRRAAPDDDGAGAVPGEFLVKPASGFFAADLEASFASLGASVLEEPAPGLLLVEVPGEPDSGKALEALRSLPAVQTAETNLLRRFHALPDDALIANQWYLDHIGASGAWDVTTGSGSVVIAHIDSGIMTTHEDLKPGIDSGRILPGYNTMTGTTDVSDDKGHGTWTAGCCAAETDNGKGVAGMGWECSLLPIKAGGSSGVSLSDEVKALRYAADHGADVITMSFGSHIYSALEQEAVDYAVERGCLVLAARGNEEHDSMDFPACLQNVIGVGASDEYDQPAAFTDYGFGTDVLAPGVSVFTTDKYATDSYSAVSGTSFSTPITAGLAGLLLGHDPSLSAAEAEYLIEAGAAGMTDTDYGYGLIDMAGALTVTNGYTDSLEPNNTVNQARPFDTGVLQSYIGCNSDSDFYSFTPRETGTMMALLDGIQADCDYDLFLHQVDKHGDWGEIIAYSAAGEGEAEAFMAPVYAGVEYALEVRCYYRFSDQPYSLYLISPEVASEWYFAEGCTGAGFDQWMCLQNPDGAASVTVDAEYMFSDGTTLERSYSVGPHSRGTIDVNREVGEGRDVSVRLSSDQPFIAERPMYFDYGGAWKGGHDLMGVTSPSPDWYFAEGTTRPGFQEWLCLQNPNGWPVETEVFFTGPGLSESRTYSLPPDSRTTVQVNGVIGAGHDVSLAVFTADGDSDGRSDRIVAERPMYFDYGGAWKGGHVSSGTTFPYGEWYFAEGYTGAGFEEWLCLQNPGAADITVEVVYMLSGEAPVTRQHAVPARSRATVRVNDEVGPGREVSIRATSDDPFVAERPIYFDYDSKWQGGSVVTGAAYPSVSWFFAEGYTGPGFEEWLCLQNPGDAAATLDISYMLADGTVIPQELTVQPYSRSTVYVNEVVGAGKELSIKIISDAPVVAERPAYFLYQGWCPGGDCTLGYTP